VPPLCCLQEEKKKAAAAKKRSKAAAATPKSGSKRGRAAGSAAKSASAKKKAKGTGGKARKAAAESESEGDDDEEHSEEQHSAEEEEVSEEVGLGFVSAVCCGVLVLAVARVLPAPLPSQRLPRRKPRGRAARHARLLGVRAREMMTKSRVRSSTAKRRRRLRRWVQQGVARMPFILALAQACCSYQSSQHIQPIGLSALFVVGFWCWLWLALLWAPLWL
jgi:hypothetical protein